MYIIYIGVAEPFDADGITFSRHFKNPFFCNGSEKHITDCIIHYHAANDKLCNDIMATSLMCQTGITQQSFKYAVLHVNVVDRSRTAHTQSCQQWFSRGKLDPACLYPPTRAQGQ